MLKVVKQGDEMGFAKTAADRNLFIFQPAREPRRDENGKTAEIGRKKKL